MIDPLGLFSVTLSFFVGKGGSVTAGFDENGFFVTARAGIGLEAGVSFDPLGQCPVQPENFDEPVPEGSMLAGVGFFGAAGLNIGLVGAGAEGTAGIGIASGDDGAPQATEIGTAEGGASLVGERGLGVHGGASGGVMATIGGLR